MGHQKMYVYMLDDTFFHMTKTCQDEDVEFEILDMVIDILFIGVHVNVFHGQDIGSNIDQTTELGYCQDIGYRVEAGHGILLMGGAE